MPTVKLSEYGVSGAVNAGNNVIRLCVLFVAVIRNIWETVTLRFFAARVHLGLVAAQPEEFLL